MNGFYTILLLVLSNIFMTFAWYGHLKLGQMDSFSRSPLFVFILISWGLAFFEYCLQVPANRIGFKENGGPFTLYQLKIIQEVITLVIFVAFSSIVFKEQLRWNHFLALLLVLCAVALVFKK
ncbi:MAG: DMT family protein [Bacteroidales bacterium]